MVSDFFLGNGGLLEILVFREMIDSQLFGSR